MPFRLAQKAGAREITCRVASPYLRNNILPRPNEGPGVAQGYRKSLRSDFPHLLACRFSRDTGAWRHAWPMLLAALP